MVPSWASVKGTRSLEHNNTGVKDFAEASTVLAQSPELIPIQWPFHYLQSHLSEEDEQSILQALPNADKSPKKIKATFMAGAEDNEEKPYERSIDVSARGVLVACPNRTFQKYLKPSHSYPVQQDHVFFSLHPEIKRRIYQNVFSYAKDDIPITLSPIFGTVGVYANDHFLAPWEVLWAIEGGLYACKRLHDELMTYFWTNYKFHIVLSKYTKPVLSKLTMNWLPMYLDRIQYLTIEADFTKLAFGYDKTAGLLQTGGVNVVKALISKIVDAILTRKTNYPGEYQPPLIAELHLKVRRYAGDRPNVDPRKLEPYCPELAFFAFDSVMEKMQGMVLECRMSGFSRSYTHLLLSRLYGASMKKSNPITPAWPIVLKSSGTPHSSFSSNSWTVMTPQTGFSGSESLSDSPMILKLSNCETTIQELSGSAVQHSFAPVMSCSAVSTRPELSLAVAPGISRPLRESLPRIQWAPDPLPKDRQYPIGLWQQPSSVSRLVRSNTGGSDSQELSDVDFDSDSMMDMESSIASASGSAYGSPGIRTASQTSDFFGTRRTSAASFLSFVSLGSPRADSPNIPQLYRSDAGTGYYGISSPGWTTETQHLPDYFALPGIQRSGSKTKSHEPLKADSVHDLRLIRASTAASATAPYVVKANIYRAHVAEPARTIAHLAINKGDLIKIGGFGKTGLLKGFNECTQKFGWISPSPLTPLDHSGDPIAVVPFFGIPPNDEQVIGIYIAQEDCTPPNYNSREEMLLKKDDIILVVGKNNQKGRWLGQNETQKIRGWCFGAYLRPHFGHYMYGETKIMNLLRGEREALKQQQTTSSDEVEKVQHSIESSTKSSVPTQPAKEGVSMTLNSGYSNTRHEQQQSSDVLVETKNTRRSLGSPITLQPVPSFRRQSSATGHTRLPSIPSPLSKSFTPDKSPQKFCTLPSRQNSASSASFVGPSIGLGLGISMSPTNQPHSQSQVRSLSSTFDDMVLSSPGEPLSTTRPIPANMTFRSPSFGCTSLASPTSSCGDRIVTTTLSSPIASPGALSPRSPNELNRLNEQDPAFRKGLAAFATPDLDAVDADGEEEKKIKRRGHRGGKKKGKK